MCVSRVLANCASVLPDSGPCHWPVEVVDTHLLVARTATTTDYDVWANRMYVKLVLTGEKLFGRVRSVLVWLRVGQVA